MLQTYMRNISSKLLLMLRNKQIRSIIQLTIGTGLYSVSLFALRSIIGNYLGPTHLGIYTLLFIIYTFGFQFVALGIGVTLTKYISEDPNNLELIKKMVSFGFIIALCSGIVFGSISIGTARIFANVLFHDPNVTFQIILVSLSFPFIAILQTNLGILNGMLKIAQYAFLYIILTIFTLLFTAVGIFKFSTPEMAYTLGLFIPTAITAVLSFIFVFKYFSFRINLNFKKRRIFIRFTLLTLIINSVAFINNQVTSLILANNLTTTEVGILSAAITIVQGLLLYPYAVQRIVFPIVSRKYAEEDWEEIKSFNRKIAIGVFVSYLILAGTLLAVSKPLIQFLFSSSFNEAVLLMYILIPTSVLYSLNAALGGVLAAIEKLHVNLLINVIFSIVVITISILLIIFYGTLGAAITNGIFYCLSTVVLIIVLRKYNVI